MALIAYNMSNLASQPKSLNTGRNGACMRLMNRLEEILAFNQRFVHNREYEPYLTSKFPNKKLVVLSCMDTRLSDLLPRAMNLNNGDTKFIKNAGAVITHPFCSTMRSILVAIYELGADEAWVIGHYGCGMASLDPDRVFGTMVQKGVSWETIKTIEHAGIDLRKWLRRIDSVPESVRHGGDDSPTSPCAAIVAYPRARDGSRNGEVRCRHQWV